MRSLQTTSGHSGMPSKFVTQHSVTNAGELPEVTETAGSHDGLPSMPQYDEKMFFLF